MIFIQILKVQQDNQEKYDESSSDQISFKNFLNRSNERSISQKYSILWQYEKLEHIYLSKLLFFQSSQIYNDSLVAYSHVSPTNLYEHIQSLQYILQFRKEKLDFPLDDLKQLISSILITLNYLQQMNFSIPFIIPQQIYLNPFKILPPFVIDLNHYLAPEYFCLKQFGDKSVVWSLGMIILECIQNPLQMPLQDFIQQLITLIPNYKQKSFFRRFSDGENYQGLESYLRGIQENIDQSLKDFLNKCLEVNIDRRASVKSLLKHPFLQPLQDIPNQDTPLDPINVLISKLTPVQQIIPLSQAIQLQKFDSSKNQLISISQLYEPLSKELSFFIDSNFEESSVEQIPQQQSYFVYLYLLQKKKSIFPYLSFLDLPNNLRKYIYHSSLQKQKSNSSKEQIAKDIPRNHQYDLLLNSYWGKCQLYDSLDGENYIQGMDAMAGIALKQGLNRNVVEKIQESLGMGGEQWLEEWYCVLRWLINWQEPELGLYLVKIGFEPEQYAVSWFMNAFASNFLTIVSFTMDKVIEIWDLVICNANALVIFASRIICDLKQKLLLMTFEECLLSIKNLEGIIDFHSCLRQTSKYFIEDLLCQNLPPSFLLSPLLTNKDMYNSPFYETHSYLIPKTYQESKNIHTFQLSVHNFPLENSVLIDTRDKSSFETLTIKNAINMPAFCEQIYIDYVKIQKKIIIVIGEQQDALKLLDQNIVQVATLQGGIEAVEENYSDMMVKGAKQLPVGWFRREIKKNKE